MAIESVATAMQANVIEQGEMASAIDESKPATPSKFLPYRKLVKALEGTRDAWNETEDDLYRLRALFDALAREPMDPVNLSGIGQQLTERLIDGIDGVRDGLDEVIASAEATIPRKRWEDGGAPDDRADAEDLAREEAASAVGDSELTA